MSETKNIILFSSLAYVGYEAYQYNQISENISMDLRNFRIAKGSFLDLSINFDLDLKSNSDKSLKIESLSGHLFYKDKRVLSFSGSKKFTIPKKGRIFVPVSLNVKAESVIETLLSILTEDAENFRIEYTLKASPIFLFVIPIPLTMIGTKRVSLAPYYNLIKSLKGG